MVTSVNVNIYNQTNSEIVIKPEFNLIEYNSDTSIATFPLDISWIIYSINYWKRH